MYALVRELGCGRFPAVVAGICFSFGGFIGAISEWPHLYEAAIWLPVVFLFLLRALHAETTTRAVFYGACGGLALGLGVLAGGLHVVIMEALVVVSAAIYATFQARETSAPGQAWRRPALVAVMIAGVGLCAGAVQLLPSMEYSRLALRWIGSGPPQVAADKIPYAYMGDGLWPHGLLQMLIPSAFGGSAHGAGSGEVTNLYLGVFPLLAGIIGVWKCWSHAWVRYLAGLWVAALLYALGSQSLLHGVMYALVPKLWLAHEAARFVFLAEFALAILAAFGLQVLFDGVRPASFWLPLSRILGAVTVACAVALVVPGLYGQPALNPWVSLSLVLIPVSYGLFRHIVSGHVDRSARLLVVGMVIFDLGAFNWSAPNKIELARSATNQLDRLRSLSGVAHYLKAQPGPFRVDLRTDQPMSFGDMYRVQATRGAAVTMLKEYLPLVGNDALLNVAYLVRPATAGEPGEVYRDENWKVYANPGACPRAWIVHQATVEPSAERTIHLLSSAEFDPRRTVLVNAPLNARLDAVPESAQETSAIRASQQNEIQVSVHAAGAGLLVLSEIYYPGWEATVNGRQAPIHRVDHLLRGIAVPRGDSQVVLCYRPMTVAAGATLSLAAFLGTALAGLAAWFQSRAGRKETRVESDARKMQPV